MGFPAGTVLKPLVKLGRSPSDCWTWKGTIDANGCAVKFIAGTSMPARRWVWSQLLGPIPRGKVVTTTCGSKQCVNPHHLRCCTQADACRATSNTTLLPEDVREIRACPFRTKTVADAYADRFGVSAQTIRDVWRRDSWRQAKPFKVPNEPAGEAHP